MKVNISLLKSFRTGLIGLLVFLFLFGCSNTMQQNYYLLSPSSSAKLASVSGEPVLSIRSVRLPDYLSQEYMAKKLADESVSLSYENLWADSLPKAIPTILARDLEAILEKPVEIYPIPVGHRIDNILEVDIDTLVASSSELFLSAKYRLITKDKIQSFYFKMTFNLESDAYSSIAKAHEKALNELAINISKDFLKQMAKLKIDTNSKSK